MMLMYARDMVESILMCKIIESDRSGVNCDKAWGVKFWTNIGPKFGKLFC